MLWVAFALGAALCWGIYGPMLHKGQVALGNPLRALLCVGIAYFLMGVLVPIGGLGGSSFTGLSSAGGVAATLAGALGAAGAVCIIWAFKSGGVPAYVMPLVFAGAPVINVLYSMWSHPPKGEINPMLWVGMLLAALGAGMVLYFKPQG